MKPNKVFLIIFSVFLTFGILLGGIYVYVSKVLTPENIRQILTQNLEETFPQAKVEVGEVDFKFGTSIDFVIKRINIEMSQPMASVLDAKLKIPVWSILKGGGVVELEINGPQFFWSKSKDSTSNWSKAMQTETVKPKTSVAPVIVPAFLATSRLNIKMKDSKIKYSLGESEKGTFLITKLLIKELGLENPAAFEVDTAIVMQLESLGELSANILLIGEADLHRYLSEGKFSLVSVATISKIKSAKNGVLPLSEIRMDLKSDFFKNGSLSAEAKMSFYDSSLSFKILRNADEFKIDNIKSSLSTKDFLSLSPKLQTNWSSGKSQINIDGQIDLSKNEVNPLLNIALTQGLTYSNLGQSFQPTLLASLKSRDVDIKTDMPIFQGQTSSTINFVLPKDLNFEKFIPNLSISTKASGLIITKNDLDRINESIAANKIDAKKREVDNVESPVVNESSTIEVQPKSEAFIVPMSWQLEIADSKFDDKNLSMKSNLDFGPNGNAKIIAQLNIDNGILSSDIEYSSKNESGKGLVSFKKFSGLILSPFISQKAMSINGEINGIAKAKFIKKGDTHRYDANYDLKITNGALSNIEPAEWLPSLAEAIKPFYPSIDEVLKNIKIEPNFSILELEGSATNEKIKFKDIFFKGIDNKFELSAKGTIHLNGSDESVLIADYKDYKGNLSSFLLEEVGTEILPLRLVGIGTNFKPDLNYTSKKLSTILLKKKGTNKVKDIAKKLLKNADKKKIDQLLKGLLK